MDRLVEENRALRKRVAELERQLEEIRSVGSGVEIEASTEQIAADRAIAGFFDQSLVMLFIADLVEGRFLRVNKKVCEVLGYSEEDLLKYSFLDRVHPDDHRNTMRKMQRLIEGEKTVGFRNRHLDAAGVYRTFEWTAVVDPDRELCYAMAIEITP